MEIIQILQQYKHCVAQLQDEFHKNPISGKVNIS